MTALLARLADSGLAVTVKGGGLQIKPKARLTDTLRAEIKAHTAALVGCLTAQAERLPVTLFSERLGDSLVLAPDGTPELQIGGMAVYTPTETGLLHTAGVSDGMLAAVHNVKTVLGGRVLLVYDKTGNQAQEL